MQKVKSKALITRNNNLSNMIKISELSKIRLEEGQKVLVCKGVKGDIISQRTGKRMGKREKVVASGVITIQNGKSFIKTTEPIDIRGTIEIKGGIQKYPFFSSRSKRNSPEVYAKIVEE